MVFLFATRLHRPRRFKAAKYLETYGGLATSLLESVYLKAARIRAWRSWLIADLIVVQNSTILLHFLGKNAYSGGLFSTCLPKCS